MLCESLAGSGVWERMDTCICMAECLCCSPTTIKTLLIGYSPMQSTYLKKKNTAVMIEHRSQMKRLSMAKSRKIHTKNNVVLDYT